MLKPVNMLSFPGRGRTVIWSFAVVVLPVLIYLAVALAVVALIGDAVTSAFVTNAMVAILITVWRARKGVKDSERPRGPDLEPSAGHPLKTPQNRIRTPRWHFWAATGLVFAFLSGQTAALLVTRIVGVDGLNGVQRSLTTTGLFQALAVALVASEYKCA